MSGHLLFNTPAAKVRRTTRREGGGTFDKAGDPVATKRYVYNPGPTVATLSTTSRHSSFGRAMRNASAGGWDIGTWRHSKRKVDVDPSTSSDDLAEATKGAQATKQHAIFDTKEHKDITLCGVGGYRCAKHGG